MDKIEIAFCKSNIVIGLFSILIFLVAGVDMISNGNHYEKHILYNKYIMNTFLVLFSFLIPVAIFYLISKLLSSEKGLIITANGIIDNSAAVNFGLIKWTDITKSDVKEIMSKKSIMIHVADYNVYLERVKNPFFLFFAKRKIKNYHYLISISSELLLIDTEDLLKLLQENFRKYKYNA